MPVPDLFTLEGCIDSGSVDLIAAEPNVEYFSLRRFLCPGPMMASISWVYLASFDLWPYRLSTGF